MQIEIEIPAIEVYNQLKSDTKEMLEKLTKAHNHFGGVQLEPEEFLDRLKINSENINYSDILRAVTHSTDQTILKKSMELDTLLSLGVAE